MSFFASVSGLQIVSGTLMIPLVGIWTADVQLASSTPVSGQCTVIIGNLTLQGFVYRSSPYGGQIRARIVGGYGGWRQNATAQGYGNPGGVTLSQVLNDAAATAGEQINIVGSRTIGNAFVRVNFAESVASDVLWQMLAQGFIASWYVAPSGITQTQAWPAGTVTTPFTVTEQKQDEGVIEIATEDYASWMPGCVFSNPLLQGPYTSAGVTYIWDNAGKFRFEVLTRATGEVNGAGTVDRMLAPFTQIVQKEIAPLRFFGRYEYTITDASTSTIDGMPTDSDLGLPDLQNVPIRADSISSYTPPIGAACEVMFTNGLPTRPVCVWTAGTSISVDIGTVPQPVAFAEPVVQMNGGLVTLLGVMNGSTPPAVTPWEIAVAAAANTLIGTLAPLVALTPTEEFNAT